uniref:Uncharacterized protein n=1 Tax=Schizaphis graminum TaxID=13262 RepID=A0A2S2P259_SCHGA
MKMSIIMCTTAACIHTHTLHSPQSPPSSPFLRSSAMRIKYKYSNNRNTNNYPWVPPRSLFWPDSDINPIRRRRLSVFLAHGNNRLEEEGQRPITRRRETSVNNKE